VASNSIPSKGLYLDWCSHEAAKFAMEHWHYSGVLQAGKCSKIGVWEDGKFIGAVVFTAGSGSTTKWATNVGLKREEMAELARIGLTLHISPVSRIVSIALRLLRIQSPGIRLIVSYADPREGHHGGIYQAGGWAYVGQTPPDVRYIDRSGREHHPRMACVSGVKISFGAIKHVVKTEDCRKIEVPGKYKYLMPLDSAMREKIEKLRQPYPKRVKMDAASTPHQSADESDPPAPTCLGQEAVLQNP